jgi:HlyD family secretion protein
MKISALGVEEQRVNVVIDLDDRAAAATRLGDGYRTEVRIVTWEADDVVQVPLGALFRRGDQWSVFVIDGDVAHATTVEIGHRNGEMAEVVSGLTAGTEVVLHPPDTLADQATVQKR